jgi:hypothetical protein
MVSSMGGGRVDAVLVVQVDVVGAQPGQGALDGGADVGWCAVAAGMGEDAELRGHHDLVTATLQCLADEFLAVEGAVDLGGVEVGDTQLHCPRP